MEARMHNAQTLIEKIRSLPADRILEVEDFVDFLKQRTQVTTRSQRKLAFPVVNIGEWPDDLSLNREDMYSSDGR